MVRLLLNPAVLPLVIPIVAIVMAGLWLIVREVIRHRERAAMIEMGIHPDLGPPQFDLEADGEVPRTKGSSRGTAG